jgi:hypothetical protein
MSENNRVPKKMTDQRRFIINWAPKMITPQRTMGSDIPNFIISQREIPHQDINEYPCRSEYSAWWSEP